MTGRPTIFNDEMAAEICARISEGRSLRSIVKDEDMPCMRSIMVWLQKHPTFVAQYARAREARADAIFDESFEIADDGSNDYMRRTGKDGEESWQLNGEHVQRSRLRVDLRKWAAGRLAPKKYGDRVGAEQGDTTATLTIKVEGGLPTVEKPETNNA